MRRPQIKVQPEGKPILIGRWQSDEDFPVHPVGSKPKRMLICPSDIEEPYLIPEHSYLFKIADGWRAQQAWSEVIAYRIGSLVSLDVPPCFLALDENTGTVGVLVEFFYGYPGESEPARLIHAADELREFGTASTGRPHGARTNVLVSKAHQVGSEAEWWGSVLTFDALIGNTDRHTENWGFLVRRQENSTPLYSFAPVFDNGTSLGYELPEKRLRSARESIRLAAYVDHGRHHCGWDVSDDEPAGHIALCGRFLATYPEAGVAMRNVIRYDEAELTNVLREATSFDVRVRFTADRAGFVAALLSARKARLSEVFGG